MTKRVADAKFVVVTKKKSIIIFTYVAAPCMAVRLYKLFQFIDGFKAEHSHRGFLHVGNEYSVFLRTPHPHAQSLIYELYESQNLNQSANSKPKLLAVSKVPISYIKEQLLTFKEELHNAKYVNPSVVPGTQVKTLREWQMDKAMQYHKDGINLSYTPSILRTHDI